MSAAVSSSVLLYATIASTHLKQIAEFQEQREQQDQWAHDEIDRAEQRCSYDSHIEPGVLTVK